MRRLGFFLTFLVLVFLLGAWFIGRRGSPRKPAPGRAVAELAATQVGSERESLRTGAAELSGSVPAPAQTEFAAFEEWRGRFLGATESGRQELMAEGRRLASKRRVVLAQLIRTDPREALESAVPMVVRQQLPPEIVALLEERVSGRGTVALIGVRPLPGEPRLPPTYRSAFVSGREFRAYVFGRRDLPGTVERTSMHGIALDGHLAIAEAPVRILEPGERAMGRPVNEICDVSGIASAPGRDAPFNLQGATAVEYNGVINVLCTAQHVSAVERKLLATEETPMTAASAGPGSSNVFGRPSQAWTHGPKTVLVMRVDFSDLPGPPRDSAGVAFDETYVANVMNVVAGFYRQNSFGRTELAFRPTVQGDSPDVTAVLRMPRPASYYNDPSFPRPSELMEDALAAARAAGFAVDGFDRVGLLQPYLDNHRFSGQAQIGGRLAWYNGEFHFAIVAHEIGHNYGVVHANAWVVPDGNPVSSSGFSQEYRDWSDVMGGGHTIADHFSQWHKSVLQWIPDDVVLTPTTSGTYRIYAFDETTPPDPARPRALKLTRDAERDYWIGYRVASRLPAFREGASLIWGYQSVRSGDLLDMTPGSAGEFDDAALPIGASFTDPVPRVTIRPIGRGGNFDVQWLDVQISFDAGVAWGSSLFAAAETEGRVVLRVRRTRDFGAALSVPWRTVDGTAVAGSDYAAGSGVLSWGAGDGTDRFIAINLVADAVTEGAEEFAVVLDPPSAGAIDGAAQVRVLIGEAGGRDPSWATDYPRGQVRDLVALPDEDTVIVGGFDPRVYSSPPEFPHLGVLKLDRDGAPVAGFAEGPGAGPNGNLWCVARLPDGRFLVGGDFEEMHGVPQRHLARLNEDGSLDTSFRPVLNGRVRVLLPLPDGRVLVGGGFTTVNGAARRHLVRLHPDGSVDASFVPLLVDGTASTVNCLALQPDGRIIAGGIFTLSSPSGLRQGLVRLLSDGSVDDSFAVTALRWSEGAGHITAVAMPADGRILVGGVFDQFNGVARGGLVQLRPDGSIDPAFVGGTDGYLEALQVLGADRIAIGGHFSAVNGQPVSGLALLSGNGQLDTASAAQGGFTGIVYRFSLLPSNRLQFIGDGHFPGPWEFRILWRMFTGVANGPGVISFNLATASGPEGGSVSVTATRTGGSSGEVVVPYGTAIGTAGATDFDPASGVLRWAHGETGPKTITVQLRADSVADPVETFSINLGNALAGGALAGPISQVTVSIQPGPDSPQPPGESWSATDVGPVGVPGSATESGNQVTVRGSGADIWGAADGFHFHAVRMDGDGTIVARVASLSNTHAWAKAGLMFREDTSAGSRNVFAYVTAGNHAGLQHRSAPGGSSAVAADILATMPQWLKLVRTGNSFAASRSLNGVDWIPLGTATVPLPPAVQVGLAVTSHNNSLLATAVFEHVEVIPVAPPTTAPAAPSGLHATAVTGTSATLAWTDNSSNETGFAIERASGGGASFAPVATVGANVTTYMDTGLAPSTTYTYRVRAVAGGLYSAFSGTYTLTTTSGPSGVWEGRDIGNVGLVGAQTISGARIDVNAAGADIWGPADGFRYVYRSWTGDGEIVARVTRLDPVHAWAKAGVMFRESLDPGARNVMALLTAGNTAGMQVRAATGGSTTFTAGPRLAVPHWVRLVRVGDTFTASTSPDGVTWTARGTQVLALPQEIFVGVATSSHALGSRTTAVYEQVTVPGTPPPPPPPGWAQSNWGAGAGSFTEDGTDLSVSAGGADIWGASDDGVFVHRTVDSDGALTMRLDSLANTHAWAKAGLMFRASAAANAANVFLAVTPGAGLTFQARSTTGAGTVEIRRAWGWTAPVWLRLTRHGDQFTAEYATDGNSWQSLGVQTLALPRAAEVGVAVSSHAAGPTTAAISNLTFP